MCTATSLRIRLFAIGNRFVGFRAITPIILGFFMLATLVCPVPGHGQSPTQSFDAWLNEFRGRALEEGVSPSVLKSHLDGVSPDSRILKKSENQAEFTTPFPEYKGYFVTDKMIQKGRVLRNKHDELLNELENKHGVPGQILIAIWGIESRYGSKMNWHDPIRAIATMAYKRSKTGGYFEGELMTILKLIDRKEIPPEHLKGSWAGALGQPQFMPSSYEEYAVDVDDDGHRDIWTSHPDILGSIANYLARNGWERGEGWVSVHSESDIPGPESRVITPDSAPRSYEIQSNFDVIMTYNRSEFYALAVGILANRIGPL